MATRTVEVTRGSLPRADVTSSADVGVLHRTFMSNKDTYCVVVLYDLKSVSRHLYFYHPKRGRSKNLGGLKVSLDGSKVLRAGPNRNRSGCPVLPNTNIQRVRDHRTPRPYTDPV